MTWDVFNHGSFPGDGSADSLWEASPKIEAAFNKLAPEQQAFATALNFTAHRKLAPYTVSVATTFTLADPDPETYLQGAMIRLELVGDGGEIKWPARVRVVDGTYNKNRTNIVTLVLVFGQDNTDAVVWAYIKQVPSTQLTGLFFRHAPVTKNDYLFPYGDALSKNEGSGSPGTEVLYSRMRLLEQARAADGYFYMRLRYFLNAAQSGTDIVWRQRSNPADFAVAHEVVDGYEAISGTAQIAILTGFGGLCRKASSFLTWGTFPGDALSGGVLTRATLGITQFANLDANPPTTPGIQVTDNRVELYLDAAP